MFRTSLPELAQRHAVCPRLMTRASVCALLGAAGLMAQARAAPPPDPADSRVAVPAVVYRSSLPPPTAASAVVAAPSNAASWRAANDTAATIGGWRAYLREVPTPAAAPASAQPATPAPRDPSPASPMPSAPPPPAHKH